ncbi:MAG: ABC-F family ATP-binding cassette domain-containing protein [Chloroflexia bacterium]
MLQLTNVSVAYDAQDVLFSGVTFHVSPGERVGLIGPNGAGKSTVLKLIGGDVPPTAGVVNVTSGRSVAYLPQDSFIAPGRTLHDEMLSVFESVLAIEEAQRDLERRMSESKGEEYDQVLEEYSRLQADFDRLGGYTIEREVGVVLHGLGFAPNDYGRQVAQFSGGWQSRMALGKVLLQRPDLLLLDEPTNHLDLSVTEWREDYLARPTGGLMIVSHDRYFLERTTERTLELERGVLTDYPGKYSWYFTEKERRREVQQDSHDRQQRELSRQQVFIDRFRAKPTKTSAAQSREKMIARIERIEAPAPESRKVKFRFPFAGASGRTVLELKGVSRTYGERRVLMDVNLLVEKGDKIAVLGPNGSGKSTIMRIMAGEDKATEGTMTVGHNVRRSYFEQHQAELLESGHSVYDEVIQNAPKGWTITDVRTLLGRFLFSGDDVAKPIEVLSGGERSRVALVKMLLDPANTLLLDEPTNHLDIPTRDMLESAIRDYDGTCIVISHDRYFLDRIATKTLEIEEGKASLYYGTYSEYRERKQRGEPPNAQAPQPARRDVVQKTKPRTAERDLRKLEAEVDKLEIEIASSEERLAEVQRVLSTPELYEDQGRYSAMLSEYGELEGRLEDLNRRWEQRLRTLEAQEPAPAQPQETPAVRERLLDRLRELDLLLEDPNVYRDEERGRVLMDEYARVHEALADLPAQGTPTAPARQRMPRPTPNRSETQTQPAAENVDRVRVRIAELERLLLDPDLFLDSTHSGPVLEEYGRLQSVLERQTVSDGRR